MASEPERPIEKLLRDAAQKRRDEAPASFEPHPATRRLLQGEVARRYPQERGARSGLNWLWRISPKLSWAVASLAVLALGVWLLRPGSSSKSQERLFARNEPAAATSAQPPVPAPVVATDGRLQPPVVSDERLSSATTEESRPSLAQKQPSMTPPSAAAPSVAPAQEGLSSLALAKKAEPGGRSDSAQVRTSELAITTAPSPPLAMAEQKAKSQAASTDLSATFADRSLGLTQAPGVDQLKDNAAVAYSANQPMPATVAASKNGTESTVAARVSPLSETATAAVSGSGRAFQATTNAISSSVSLAQHFVRNIPRTKAFAGQNAQTSDQRLLLSFQVEQNGPELRVKDEDGSVYFGYLQPAQTAAVLRDTVKAVPATAGRTANLKLTDAAAHSESAAPQTYFFRVAGTNQTLKLPVLFTGSISNALGYGLSPTQLSGARISGRVRVGTQREFEVLASPR